MVNIKDGSVYVNGQKLNETYLPISQQTIVSGSGEIDKILGTNEFYVLGDNRSHSRDSRDLGPITRDRIVSHVWFRLYPLNQIRAFAAVNYQNSY